MDQRSTIDIIAERCGMSSEECSAMIDAFRETVVDAAAGYDAVSLPGFGCFEVRKRAERVAVHPGSGKRLLIPPKLALIFRPSMSLKQKVNK